MTAIGNKSKISFFQEQITTERFPIIEMKSAYPISETRDVITTSGSATVTKIDGEIVLNTTASGSDYAELKTSEIGRYIAHSTANTGIGLIPPSALTGNQFATWGYEDGYDGFRFGKDAVGGLYVEHLKAGVSISKVYSSGWTNENNLTLDDSVGYVWNIDFAHYGYGPVEFSVFTEDVNKKYVRYILHRLDLNGEISLTNPNLPITVRLNNNGTANTSDIKVGGRQFSVLGKYVPTYRTNGDTNEATSIGTSWTHIASFRKKSDFQNINVRLREIHITPDAICYYQLVKNNTITGVTWSGLTNQITGETALEIVEGTTQTLDGIVVGQGHALGANKNEQQFIETLNTILSFQQPISLFVRSKTTTVNFDWSIDFLEEW